MLRLILGNFFFLLAQGHAADLSSGRGDFGGKLDAGDSLYLGELAAASRLANRKIIILSHNVSLSLHTILSENKFNLFYNAVIFDYIANLEKLLTFVAACYSSFNRRCKNNVTFPQI